MMADVLYIILNIRWITMYQDYLVLTGPMILHIALLTINIHHTISIELLK